MGMFPFAKGRINLGFPIFFLESWSDFEEFFDEPNSTTPVILLMEESLHHLGFTKPCK